MSDENISENKPEPDKKPQSLVADAIKVLEHAEVVKDSRRQVVDAALIGTCLLFIATMLGLQKPLDGDLTTAAVFFCIAIPMLIYGFLYAEYKAKPIWGWLILAALQLGAWVIEALGWIAIAIGIAAVIKHVVGKTINGSDTGLVISSSIDRLKVREAARRRGRDLCLVRSTRGLLFPAPSSSLDTMQNPLTQECKTGFAIHHPLDQFNSGHLSFHLPV